MELLDSSDDEASGSAGPSADTTMRPGKQSRPRDDADETAPQSPDTKTTDHKRQRLDMIAEILGISQAEELVREIENMMPRIAGNRRQRRSARLQEAKIHVAEVFSPPRIAAAAKRHGLIPGWSLDLSMIDPDTGQPWDLSIPADRKRSDRNRRTTSRFS